MSDAQRLIELEIKITEQERLTEELSNIIIEQWKTIEKTNKKLDVLTKRFLALEEQTHPDIPVTKPPHW